MTEQEQFASVDAVEGNTMVTFSDKSLAMRYVAHRQATHGAVGLIALCEDTRTKTGLCVLWRDPVKASEFEERLANCRWLLEETLAGRAWWPQPGEAHQALSPRAIRVALLSRQVIDGAILFTPGAEETFPMDFIEACIIRHTGGDWGEMSDDDQDQNELALANGERLLSVYAHESGQTLWVITDAGWDDRDRSLYDGDPPVTTALLAKRLLRC